MSEDKKKPSGFEPQKVMKARHLENTENVRQDFSRAPEKDTRKSKR